MKFEIYKENNEPTIQLDFRHCEEGMDVIAMDNNGYVANYLVRFNLDGTLHLYPLTNKSLGFSLDSNKKIVIT